MMILLSFFTSWWINYYIHVNKIRAVYFMLSASSSTVVCLSNDSSRFALLLPVSGIASCQRSSVFRPDVVATFFSCFVVCCLSLRSRFGAFVSSWVEQRASQVAAPSRFASHSVRARVCTRHVRTCTVYMFGISSSTHLLLLSTAGTLVLKSFPCVSCC